MYKVIAQPIPKISVLQSLFSMLTRRKRELTHNEKRIFDRFYKYYNQIVHTDFQSVNPFEKMNNDSRIERALLAFKTANFRHFDDIRERIFLIENPRTKTESDLKFHIKIIQLCALARILQNNSKRVPDESVLQICKRLISLANISKAICFKRSVPAFLRIVIDSYPNIKDIVGSMLEEYKEKHRLTHQN